MFKRFWLFAFVLAPIGSYAQTLPPICNPSYSRQLICALPQIYGSTGLSLPNPSHEAHFVNSQLSSFVPITASIGTELGLSSLPSPASGVLFTFSPATGAETRSSESYGPIVSDRAETVGRHRIFIAATYQYNDYSTLDGVDLHHLPVVFKHAQFDIPFKAAQPQDYIPGTTITGKNGMPEAEPIYEEEYIRTSDNIDLKIHEVTLYATYGLTSRIDASVAVPIVDVRMGITSNANIVRQTSLAQPLPMTDPLYGSTDGTGFFHFFNLSNPAGSISHIFSTSGLGAAGIGDVVFRVKGTALNLEHFKAAVGVDVRTPTGDATNFLGTGAIGVKPFLVASYSSRISPHVNLGYQYNGTSVLANSTLSVPPGSAPGTGTSFVGTRKLPNQFFYSAGADMGITRRVTLAVDFLGQRLSSTFRIRETGFTDITGVTHSDVPTVVGYKDSENLDNLSVGGKFNLVGNLLLTANAMFKLNDAGLRSTVVPLVGLSYTF